LINPLQQSSESTTITYDYDPLYRLTNADYLTGSDYHYAYDAVGNRLTQQIGLVTTNYVYDNANRLTNVNGVTYLWDANGNLLSDGVNAYAYDSANRLKTMSGQSTVSSYGYNGLGDRLAQTVNGVTTNYTLDLNTGLTQVLDDGTSAYVYGLGRIAQVNTGTEYFLGDALGSVRQLVNSQGEITLAKSYDPYGTVSQSVGGGESIYAYTGEQVDASGLTYLRARYYASGDGRFLTRDTWEGDYNSPLSLNRWNYVNSQPVNHTDSRGHSPDCSSYSEAERDACERDEAYNMPPRIEKYNEKEKPWNISFSPSNVLSITTVHSLKNF
jgi:RHS repeat-associated protein